MTQIANYNYKNKTSINSDLTKSHMEKKTGKTHSKLPSCKVPAFIHAGIWRIIFSYLGVNKDLAKCRQVCKKWRLYVRKYIKLVLIQKNGDLNNFKQDCQSLMTNCSDAMKTDIDALFELKRVCEEYIEILPKKYTLFHRISDLGRLKTPTVSLHYGIKAVMFLITDKEEIIKNGGKLDWQYCRKRLLDKNFMKTMKDTTIENLTQDRIAKFQDLLNASLITPDQLAPQSTQACYMLEWALKMVDYKNYTANLEPKTQGVWKQFLLLDMKTKEIEWLNSILPKKSK